MLAAKKYAFYFLLAVVVLLFSGCASREIRHLASDASLISPGQTTQQQVVGMLGVPDQKLKLKQGGELWRYYQANKSALRQTPLIGNELGEENFDVLTITFRDKRVVDCIYRQLGEKEFAKLRIGTGAAAQ